MIRERVAKASEKTEQMLLIGMCKDYNNFNKIRRYVGEDDFGTDEFKGVYLSIKSLYENSGFKMINEHVVDTYSIDKNLSESEKMRFKTFVSIGKNIEVDFDGTYNQFRRNSGMLKFIKESEKHGGIDNMIYDIYNKTESADDLKMELDGLNKLCFKAHKTTVKTTSLSEGMVKYVKERMFSDDNAGIPFLNLPLLQSYVKGIHTGLTGVCSFSGFGKSSWAITLFSLPILQKGEKLITIHNEQEEDEIRSLYLMAYITRIKGNKLKLHRNTLNNMNQHKVTQEQMDFLIECAQNFEEEYRDRLEFVFVPRFNEDDLEALILEYERKGYKNVLLDTFKIEDATLGWQGMDNLANRMDGIAKERKLKIIYTAQLAQHMSWRRYLDADCVGKAKSLKDTATEFYLFRRVLAEEIPTIKCSYWVDGKWTHNIQLNPEKTYLAWFLNKTRHGEDDKVIIMQYDMGYLYLKEIGVTNSIKNDKVGGK